MKQSDLVFLPTPPQLQINGRQFPMEAYYQRHICHPNIIELLDIFTHEDNFVFVLERPEDSSDLFDIIDAGDGMTEEAGRRFFYADSRGDDTMRGARCPAPRYQAREYHY